MIADIFESVRRRLSQDYGEHVTKRLGGIHGQSPLPQTAD
jgi:hypothetical protein